MSEKTFIKLKPFTDSRVTLPNEKEFRVGEDVFGNISLLRSGLKESNIVTCVIAKPGIEFVVGLLYGLFYQRTTVIIDPRFGVGRINDCLKNWSSVTCLHDNASKIKIAALKERGSFHEFVNMSNLTKLQRSSETNPIKLKDFDTRANPFSDIVLFTSGSTGKAKGVVISGHDLLERVETEIDWFKLSHKDHILGVLPFSFDVGFTQLLATLFSGGNFCIGTSWLPRDIIKQIKNNRISGMAATPIIWKTLLSYPDQGVLWETLNSLRYFTLSGGGLPSSTLKHMVSKMKGPSLIKTYGQTEFFRLTSFYAQISPSKIATVGKAYPGVTLTILDENGEKCSVGVKGEIHAKGLGRMRHYVGQPEPTQEQAGLHATGDIGSVDKDGYLTIHGRLDDMVKILDQRIYPADVARTIDSILGISDTEVVAVEYQHQCVLVAFQIVTCSLGLSCKEVMLKLRKQMASHMVPVMFEFLDGWPSTSSGKLDKTTLKNKALELMSKK